MSGCADCSNWTTSCYTLLDLFHKHKWNIFNSRKLFSFFFKTLFLINMNHKNTGLATQFLSSYTKLEKMILFTMIIHALLFVCLFTYTNYLMSHLSTVWFQEGLFIFLFISGVIIVRKILSLRLNYIRKLR